MTAPDLRGGAALVLAGLGVGDGSCVRVLDAGHIRRGYADLAGDLRRLGADCRAGRTGTEAVSYTHLDVYKRQELCGVALEQR